MARVTAHGMSTCVSEAERKRVFPDPFAPLSEPGVVLQYGRLRLLTGAQPCRGAAAREWVILQSCLHSLETGLASAVGHVISRSSMKKNLWKVQATTEK